MMLLPSNTALAQHGRVICIATVLPMHFCDAVQLLQLALVESHLSIVACIQKQKLHCHEAAVVQHSTGTTHMAE